MLPVKKTILGDRAYISKLLQTDLFEQYSVNLTVPFRNIQHDYIKDPKKYKLKRQMVETFFSQMCDQLNLKRNYAKSYKGLVAKLASKLSSANLYWINLYTAKDSSN